MRYLQRYWRYILVVLGMFFTLIAFQINGDSLINVDMSSEMILGKILRDEGGILSKDWCYSTELRVINTQLIYKLGFFFSDNWHKVRFFSLIFILLSLFFSYAFLLHKMELDRYIPLTGLVLILPFSGHYREFVLWGGFYATHIVFAFLTLALFISCKSKNCAKLSIFLNCLLAFLGGLNGIRYTIIIYLPLLITLFIIYFYERREKKLIGLSFSLLICNLLGFLVNNCLLIKNYTFFSFTENRLGEFNFADFLNVTVKAFLEVWGYIACNTIFSWQGIGAFSALAFCALLLIVFITSLVNIDKLSYEHKVVVLLGNISFLVTAILLMLSGTQRHTRYLLPSIIVMLPIVAVYLSHVPTFRNKIFSSIFVICLVLQSLSLSFTYDPLSVDYKAAAQWLEKSGYVQGVASFPNSAPITEFSNGKIDVYAMMAREDSGCLIMRKTNWLQRKSKLEHDPVGKIFLLLSDKERAGDEAHIYADDKYLVYARKGLNIYDYDDYNTLLNNVIGKNLLTEANILTPKEDLNVFSVALLPGKYYLEIDGKIEQEFKGKLLLYQSNVVDFSLKDGLNKIPVNIPGREAVIIDIDLKNSTPQTALIKSISFSKRDT